MTGLYERSDAMLAIYPGGGARFARHVDNTTVCMLANHTYYVPVMYLCIYVLAYIVHMLQGDGRRLTVLIYLNPSWTADNGGALRISPPTDVATSSSAKAVEVPDRPAYGDDVDVLPLGGRVAMFYSTEVRDLYAILRMCIVFVPHSSFYFTVGASRGPTLLQRS